VRVVYGANPVRELLRTGGHGLTELWLAEGSRAGGALEAAAREVGARVRRAPRQRLDRLAGTDHHQGVVALVEGDFRYAEVGELLELARKEGVAPLVLVLDGVEDPQHLGAIARSAVALGAHGLVIPRDRAAGVTPAAIKASAGVLLRCPVARVTNISRIIDEFKEDGIWSTALAADADRAVQELDLAGPTALVLGNEGEGVRPLVRKTCDRLARIEMTRGVESLSVAAAAAIVLFEAARQRRAARR
jgi:23S rRNA (guanosine2251-2'-O)-methyltransferase